MEWVYWISLILGSSFLAAFIAFGLEWGKSRYKEITEYNNSIALICNDLKTIRKTFESGEFKNITQTTSQILIPTGNLDYLTKEIAGKITSNTLANLQQIHRNAISIREESTVRNMMQSVQYLIDMIDSILKELRGETKRRILFKPKVE